MKAYIIVEDQPDGDITLKRRSEFSSDEIASGKPLTSAQLVADSLEHHLCNLINRSRAMRHPAP